MDARGVHPLLHRQLEECLLHRPPSAAGTGAVPGGAADPGWEERMRSFLETVNRTYLQADSDRTAMKHSASGSSREIRKLKAELRHAKFALAREKAVWKEILASLREAVWLQDPISSCASYVNPAFGDIFGRSESEILADADLWIKVAHPEDAERARDAA